ncbi:MAG TPA: helix-turn-helix domain-containing GNAT family N-acetyltransferase [Thermoanaerobaculia bacterium]|nr:helix-turn-helix domain-containing GNAT family N-acetyltransferase [Thermoanaerobaculia bacterium]
MPEELVQRVAAVRRFNRFYTQKIGVLHEGLLRSPFSLTEGRVLYELAHREQASASAIAADLGLDRGYLSRILSRFARRRLVGKTAAPDDRRKSLLHLTEKGQEAFAALNDESRHEIAAMLSALSPSDQGRLVEAMGSIESVLATQPEEGAPFLLRPHQAGDMGWVVQRHGILYAEEYGWDERFEALVAEIVARFLQRFDPRRERCWIAEREGERVGSVFVVRKSKRVAQLRLLLVEPSARGLGIGNRLVTECVRFARQAGYRKLMLWTNDVLHAARRIYIKHGFLLVAEEKHDSFGHDLTAQTWELSFRA